ncbi:MAG: ADP-glyceromanno-heptose 6-epimerase [Cytophagales bacterium]|nr:MAG: ADP-glyceromanno-heptose 6-epimerase [Cytophagales bacterium]
MIVITGGLGFIGSCFVNTVLSSVSSARVVVVDDFSKTQKNPNLANKIVYERVERKNFEQWLNKFAYDVQFVYHLGARTDTTEFDQSIFDELNLHYSQMVWKTCAKLGIPLVYASSAATYGNGEYGYQDKHELCKQLVPLNPYGHSKNDFDIWALEQPLAPPFWAGLKFFNVYGPNEYHKGRMASVIFHTYNQIKNSGAMKLFRSHNPNYRDGEQLRDFVYVKDVCQVLLFMYSRKAASGIYNLGTGKARTFLDLVRQTFKAMNVSEDIAFVDTPEDIRDKYQYFTEADMSKLSANGYKQTFTSLEDGIKDYVQNYLIPNKYL